MEVMLRFIVVLLKLIGIITFPILWCFGKIIDSSEKLPKFDNSLLEICAIDLAQMIRRQEVKSETIVKAYIQRIQEVNPLLNAVVEDRFTDALEDARKADEICSQQLDNGNSLADNQPLLGVPFTVKESCSLKGLLCTQGTLALSNKRSNIDGEVITYLKKSGAIPLLVSNTPEYCYSWESYNFVTGRTLNPHNRKRTAGGSSGGEAALLGAGASLFGVGSDIAGSIRMPALYNGIFGHKPTGGLVSVTGHMPTSSDASFRTYLSVGPMCRYAKDLPMLLDIMAGPNAPMLHLNEPINIKKIKVFHAENLGMSSVIDVAVDNDIKTAQSNAVQYLHENGLETNQLQLNLHEAPEIILATLFLMTDIPDLLLNPNNPKKRKSLFFELVKAIVNQSKNTFAGLFFMFLIDTKAFISPSKMKGYVEKGIDLKRFLLGLLGDNGVLLLPTFPRLALRHYEYFSKILGVMYPTVINILGFPATHVPMGMNKDGLPVGFQVVAAPHQDRLCIAIAKELETAFGGWRAPSSINST